MALPDFEFRRRTHILAGGSAKTIEKLLIPTPKPTRRCLGHSQTSHQAGASARRSARQPSMSKPLEILPDALLDELVSCFLKIVPSLRSTFLSSLGSRIHASAVRVLFSTLTLQDDARISGRRASRRSIASPLFSNPGRYAPAVRTLIICDPDVPHERRSRAFNLFSNVDFEIGQPINSLDTFHPIDAHCLSFLLAACSSVEEFVWKSSAPPPDGLCESFISYNSRITQFSCIPALSLYDHQPSPRSGLVKWDAPSLPLLSNLPITSLRLSQLSQAGARAFSVLLSNLGEYSTLEELRIDFVWLDDRLCEKIVEAGRRLRKLNISTSGTKLSDKGITGILEGCDGLEELVLDQVQGRLSRSLWTKPSLFPPALQHLQIIINEAGPHHSWTTDHLLSLHAVPVELLTGLSIIRHEASPRLENDVPTYEMVVDDFFTLKPVPREFVETLRGAKSLTMFECDWWAWSAADIKIVLESCPNIERMRFCLDAPFSKLTSLTSTFASLSNLSQLAISVNPLYSPGQPPVPQLPFPPASLPTPKESPVLRPKYILPQLLDFDQMQTQTCLVNANSGDPSMPPMRDVKRFVRKCPKLALLEWYGKAGRGSWTVIRPTTSKISINVSVEYNPPIVSRNVWKIMLRAKDIKEATTNGWIPNATERVGRIWTGDTAEGLAVKRLAEKEKQDATSSNEKERSGKAQDAERKARSLYFSTSSSGSDISLFPTPARSSHSKSPEFSFIPLTPPHSETSLSARLSGVSESIDSNLSNGDDLGAQAALHNRSSSGSEVHPNGPASQGPARSMTSKETNPQRSGYFGKNTSPGIPSGGVKFGRGRGGRGNTRNIASGGDEISSHWSDRRRTKPQTFGSGSPRGKKSSTQSLHNNFCI